jgi:hypothetical protein
MIAKSYENILNLPVFGYAAKTAKHSPKVANLFPLSRSIRNPFTPNHPGSLMQAYSDCVNVLEQGFPVNLNPTLQFFRSLGVHNRVRLARKAEKAPSIKGTADSFYVLYVLSTGLIDDIEECMKTLKQDWFALPLQIHIISLAPSHLSVKDQDTVQLMQECNRLNQISGWPQF